MVSGKKIHFILLGLSILYQGGCIEHENPLDPENELTRGIGFIGMFDVNTPPQQMRFSDDNLLFTFPSYSVSGYVEKYSFTNEELVSLGEMFWNTDIRDIAFSPRNEDAVLISDNRITFWNAATMSDSETRTVETITSFTDVCYGTDGERIYASPILGEKLYVYSASSHELTDTIPDLPRNIFHLYPYQDSIYLFAFHYGIQVTRLIMTGEEIEREDWSVYPHYFQQSEDLIAFSPEDQWMIWASGSVLYHGYLTESMTFEWFDYSGAETILDVEIDPEGEFLYVGGQSTLSVYLLNSLDLLLDYRLSDEFQEPFLLEGLEPSTDGKNVFINAINPTERIARLKIRF